MTKRVASLIKSELEWMRDAQQDLGHIPVDPYLIMVGRHNAGLKRLFAESGLDRKDPDHWKLLLARTSEIVYPPPKAGPGRPIKWSAKLGNNLLKDAFKLRLQEPKKAIQKIAEELDESEKWKEHVVDRERIHGLLRLARTTVGADLSSIADHTQYRIRQRGKGLRDIVWAFSREGKAELLRRKAVAMSVKGNVK